MKTSKILVNVGLIVLLIWFLISHQQKIRSTVASRDSIQYWATGKLLVHHENPYSVRDVEVLESSEGYSILHRERSLKPQPYRERVVGLRLLRLALRLFGYLRGHLLRSNLTLQSSTPNVNKVCG